MTAFYDFCSQLKLSHPDHMLVKRASSAEDNFERAIQSVAWCWFSHKSEWYRFAFFTDVSFFELCTYKEYTIEWESKLT